MRKLTTLALVLAALSAHSSLTITNGIRIVQFGDSVSTPNVSPPGMWPHYMESFYVMRYPAIQQHWRCEGRSGRAITNVYNTSSDPFSAYDQRVLAYRPNLASILLTINGGDTITSFSNSLYSLSSTRFVKAFDTNGVAASTNYHGGLPLLLGVLPQQGGSLVARDRSDVHQSLAQVNSWPYVNLWRELIVGWSNDIAAGSPILGWVNAHPGLAGHLTVAYAIVNALGEDGLVSTAAIDASAGTTVYHTNCTIGSLSAVTTNVTFTRLDTKLPMCWDDAAAPGTTMYPQIFSVMNRYMLVVSNLLTGNYRITIDGVTVATNSAAELQAGINMTTHTSGPIYDQRKEVLGRIRDKQGIDRTTFTTIIPHKGIEDYKSEVTHFVSLGEKNDQLINDLATFDANTDALDVLIKNAAQPVTRSFAVQLIGAPGSPPPTPYIPPIGIPAPVFGITNIVSFPNPWTNTVVGAYYIDNSDPNAVDGTNTYGNPSLPRLTIPNGDAYHYEAGAVIRLQGGPYSPGSSVFHLNFTNGTAAQPIFFVGFGTNGTSGTKARILNREVQLTGTYFIMDNLYVQGDTQRGLIRLITGQGPNSHDFCIRNCELTDPGATVGSVLSGNGSNVVLYANYCHHTGDYQTTNSSDVHSIQVPDGAHNVWVLDSDLGFTAGDSVQVNGGQAFVDLPGPVYIGRNRLHDNKENSVDLKTCHDVIVSENECYNFPTIPALGGSGEAFAINDENQPNTGNHNLWIILNRIHDAGQSSLRHQSWCHAYGNVAWNITNAFGGTANGINSWGTFTDQFENNTIYNVDRGVYIFDGGDGARHELRNNIIANNKGPESFRLENAGATNSVLANCIFPATPGNMIWGSTTYTSVAALQSGQSAYATNNLSGAPAFANSVAHDFTLQDGSLGINQGTVPTAPAQFMFLYGLDIAFDINHTHRPQGGVWDVGAFESPGGVGPPPPSGPRNTYLILSGNAKITGNVNLGP